MIQLRTVSRLTVTVCAVALALLAGACATPKYSGYLDGNYSKLKKEKDPTGVKRLVWLSPGLTRANYQKMIIDKVTFYPAPAPNQQVSQGVLTEIQDYLNTTLRQAVGSEIPLVDRPGPGVVRMKVAITGSSVDKRLKPYQYIPIALIVAGAQEAAGQRKYDVKLRVESELTDSVTGQPLGFAVRDAKGVNVKGKKQLTFEEAKPQIDKWGESVHEMVIRLLKKKPSA